MAEDKARNRVPSCDSARARNAVFRPQGPAVARMGFFNGLLGALPGVVVCISIVCITALDGSILQALYHGLIAKIPICSGEKR